MVWKFVSCWSAVLGLRKMKMIISGRYFENELFVHIADLIQTAKSKQNEVLPESWTSCIVHRTPPTFCAIM